MSEEFKSKEIRKTLEGGTEMTTVPSLAPAQYSIFTLREKQAIVALVSLAGLFSPLTANIYFPSIPLIATDLGVTVQSINLSVTYYMIFQGVAPAFWGSLCDVIGRRIIYLVTFVIYVGASSGLAVTHSYGLLIGLRCIQAAGSASVIAIGAGSIGDIAPPSERGGYMSFFSLGAMLGPAAGPIAGGLLAQTYGWQATFAFLAVFGAIILIVMALFLPETLRAKVGDGSIPARGLDRTLYSFFSERRHPKKLIPDSSKEVESLPVKTWRDAKPWTPFKLFGEKDVLLLLTFNSVGYTLFYCVITSTSTSLQATYGLSQTALGLCFIANGAGCIVASIMNGPRLNRDYRVVTEQLEAARIAAGGVEKSENRKKMEANDLSNFPIEHARLRSLPIFFIGFIGAVITYGWTLDRAVHLSVPLIAQFIVGLTITTQFNSVATLLVDLFPGQSASATASNNFYRCLLGAAGTAVIDPVITRLGPGWAFTMLAFINVILGVPLIVLEWKYGMQFRSERAQKEILRKEMKRQKKLRLNLESSLTL